VKDRFDSKQNGKVVFIFIGILQLNYIMSARKLYVFGSLKKSSKTSFYSR